MKEKLTVKQKKFADSYIATKEGMLQEDVRAPPGGLTKFATKPHQKYKMALTSCM
jgi:hypothetical protein